MRIRHLSSLANDTKEFIKVIYSFNKKKETKLCSYLPNCWFSRHIELEHALIWQRNIFHGFETKTYEKECKRETVHLILLRFKLIGYLFEKPI